jgi:hypothetical protein
MTTQTTSALGAARAPAEYLDERIGEKYREVWALESLYEGLREGSMDYRDWCPEMRRPGWTECQTDVIATEECAGALDIARAEFAALERQAKQAGAL